MTTGLTVEREVHFSLQGRGRKEMRQGQEPKVCVPPGRVPRGARLMALAIRYDQLLRDGQIKDYTELARLGHVTRTRVCQVMNLLQLAPDIQEAILYLPLTERGRDPLHLRQLQAMAAVLDWRKQRQMWQEILSTRDISLSPIPKAYSSLGP